MGWGCQWNHQFPLDKGISLSAYVARALTAVEKSGLEYRLTLRKDLIIS